jgi:hypothetical protein
MQLAGLPGVNAALKEHFADDSLKDASTGEQRRKIWGALKKTGACLHIEWYLCRSELWPLE